MASMIRWVASFPFMQYGVGFLQDFMIKTLQTGPVPSHVAFVMDGNRRFAKHNQLELREGHVAGFESLIKILEFSSRIGIQAVTVYAFSIENFNRPQHEVDTLFSLIRDKIGLMVNEEEIAKRAGIQIRILGNRSMIPDDILETIIRAEELTKDNDRLILNICFPYTSRDDITSAIQRIAKRVEDKELDPEEIDMPLFEKELYTSGSPPLDILIRTSGATRLSDFMLWEGNMDCHVEFVEALWPDFSIWDMYRVCIKWSYERTKELRNMEITQSKRIDRVDNSKRIDFSKLPPPPPTVRVTEIKKNKAVVKA